jgi:hypothetical protein
MAKQNQENRQHLSERNIEIRACFFKLKTDKIDTEKALRIVAKKYYLSPFTVHDIVFEYGVYANF